jgi:hypothetical protein
VDHWAGRGLLGAPAAAAAAAAHRAVVRRASAGEPRGHRGELLRLRRICCFEDRDPKRWGGHATCTGGRPAEPRVIELYSKRFGKPPKPIFEPMMFAQLLLLQKGVSDPTGRCMQKLTASTPFFHNIASGSTSNTFQHSYSYSSTLLGSSMPMTASERTQW